MKKIVAILLTLVLSASGVGFVGAEENFINIAPESNIMVSSTYGEGTLGLLPEYVVDDNDDSAWVNGYSPNTENSFRLTFAYSMTINSLSILMYPGSDKDFEIRLLKSNASEGYDVLHTCGPDEPMSVRTDFQVEKMFPNNKYSGVLVITHAINGTIGIKDLKVFVPESQVGLVNVAKDKKVTGGNNAFNLPAAALVDGSVSTPASIQGGYPPFYIDIDLGKKFPISRVELFTYDYTTGGGRSEGIQIYASNTPGFTDPDDMVLLKQFNEPLVALSSYGFDVDGSEYRYIRFTCVTEDFVPLMELSVFAQTEENYGRWTLSDAAGEINSLEGKTPASLSIPVYNGTGSTKNYTAIALITDSEGKVIACGAKTEQITGNGTVMVDLTGISGTLPSGCKIKAVLVDSYLEMNQLCGDFTIDEGGNVQ